MTESAAFTARNISKEYATPSEPLTVLEGIDLELASGESLAITGPSGCGKSTLLHILGALDNPTAGEVRLGTTDPFALSETELAQFRGERLGFIFQEHYLLPQLSVLENVLAPTLVAAGGTRAYAARAHELIAKVGLGERLEHRPSELSGGERQRTAIARALIRSPELLLCDEPTGNLDPRSADGVGDLFLELHSELQGILIVVTHSLRFAARFDRRVELTNGRLAVVEDAGNAGVGEAN
jgi:lipoprotein-releasing system ATP-binding protein